MFTPRDIRCLSDFIVLCVNSNLGKSSTENEANKKVTEKNQSVCFFCRLSLNCAQNTSSCAKLERKMSNLGHDLHVLIYLHLYLVHLLTDLAPATDRVVLFLDVLHIFKKRHFPK